MKITIVGTGYVGLVTGVCLAHVGHYVTCIDINQEKVDLLKKGKPPNHEPKLEELLRVNLIAKKIHFTTDYSMACKEAEVIIISVGTPMGKDGDVDLTDFYRVGVLVSQYLNDKCVIVTKSTVPVGTTHILKNLMSKTIHDSHYKFSVVSNPEFLREGSAIEDTLRGERIVIGTEDEHASSVMREMYEPFGIPIIETDIRSAEMIKYASNAFLATKISYINEIATLCEKIGANVQDVAKGMGMDSRIGEKYLQPGIGFGGSCFPKDLIALKRFSERVGQHFSLIDEIININLKQHTFLVQKAKERFGSLLGKRVTLLGLAFKPNTDDVREAPSIVISNELLNHGAKVIAYDPVAMEKARYVLRPEIVYASNIREALNKADMAMILTEWDEIKNMNLKVFSDVMNTPIVFDGRNCFSLELLRKHVIEYHSIGRQVVRNIQKEFVAISKE